MIEKIDHGTFSPNVAFTPRITYTEIELNMRACCADILPIYSLSKGSLR